MQKAYLAIVIILFALALWLRFDGVFTKSFAFTYDVGRDMLALASLSHGHISLIGFTTGLPGVFYGPWWYWILLPSFLLGGGNPQFVAGFIALSGILTVLFITLLGKKIGGPFLSITALALTAVSGQLISVSSQIWNPNLAPLWLSLVLLIIYALTHEKSHKKILMLFISLGLLVGLLFEAEIVFGTLFVLGFLVFLLCYFFKQLRVENILSFIFGFIIILSPRLLFELRHNFLMTRTILATFGQPGGHAFSLISLWTRTQFLLGEWGNTIGGNNPLIGAIVFVFTVVILCFFWRKLSKQIQLFAAFSGILTFVAWLLLLLFQHDLWSHYVVAFPVLWVLVVSIALYALYHEVSKVLAIVCLVGLFLLNIQPQKIMDRLTKPLFAGDIAVYRNQLAIVDEVYTEAGGHPFKYSVYTPPIMDYPYQYLFQWYGKTKYGYSASGPEAKTLFVVIEPDTDHPTLRDAWVQSHAKDGMIVSEKTFATGVLLQKRIIQ